LGDRINLRSPEFLISLQHEKTSEMQDNGKDFCFGFKVFLCCNNKVIGEYL